MEKAQADKSAVKFIVLLYFLVSIALLAAALAIKKGDDVFWINQYNSPISDFFFSRVTNLGDGLIFIPIILILPFVRFKYLIMGIAIWISHGAICYILKRNFFYFMQRPVSVLDTRTLHFIPSVVVNTDYSFPSGHTATIFSAALFLSLLINKRGVAILLLLVALLVAYSRIYLLEHFLIDIAGGALIGTGTTLLAWSLFKNANKPYWMNKAIVVRL
jgi:membrane-associated phospholipid phosphatase